jgi:hypothetical protein
MILSSKRNLYVDAGLKVRKRRDVRLTYYVEREVTACLNMHLRCTPDNAA